MRGSTMSKPISAKRTNNMALTRVEKERLKDSSMKLQSVADSLQHVDPKKVPKFQAIEECLEDAEQSLKLALAADATSVN